MSALNFLPNEWPAISRRLDEALALTPTQRDAWLASLTEADSVRRHLRRLFDQADALETGSFLAELPRLDALPAPDAHADSPLVARAGACIGPYRLMRELGVGGMGFVWLAERIDGRLKRQVALKLPRLHWSQGLAERMARERDILASLDHPHIARIHDAGVDELGRPYLALEFVEGEPIDAYCARQGLSVAERLPLVLQIARAVAHAHARLVVHRDLKPANILIDAQGQVRLLDFGIAKLIEGELTPETALTREAGRAMTLDYASPEQIRGDAIGTASDVYSLGVVAYELLAQAKPYRIERRSAAALEEAIASVEVRPASSAAPSREIARALSGDLDAILNKALKKDVAERYASVEAFAQDIERHRARQPVLARPDAWGYRVRRFVARNRLAVGAAVVTGVSLAAGAGVSAWQAIEARQERLRAERVKDFIGSIFASANPYGAGTSELSVRELLKAGSDRVEQELKNEPATAAELLGLLSASWRDLGETDAALKTAQAADAAAARIYRDDHPVRARLWLALARAQGDKGDRAAARGLLERAIAIQRRLGAAGAIDLARSLGALSSAVVNDGRTEEAITLAREAADLLLRVRGPADALTISSIGELSNKLMIGRRAEEALVQAERSHGLAVQAFGNADHPVTRDQSAHLAYALEANGRYTAARERWQAVVDSRRRAFNPRGPQVSGALVGLGRSQMFLGDLKAAAQSFEESLAMMQGWGARVDGELALRHYTLGRIALQSRQADKALRLFDTAIEYGSAVYGTRAGRVRDAQDFRAAALVYAGRLGDAQTVIEAQLAQDRAAGSPSLRMSLRHSALLDRARGDANAPLIKMLEVQQIESKMKDVPRRARAQTLSELGRAQLDASQLDRAAQSLAQAVALFDEELAMTTPDQADAWLALGRVRVGQGQAEQALALFEKAEQFWTAFDPDNAFAAEAAYWNARALAKGQDRATRLARAMQALAASPWPSHRLLAQQGRSAQP